MIAFLGTGLLGSNFVRALRRRGEPVQVWNRNADRAKKLEVEGAKAFSDVVEAVRGATRIHLTLSDDAAVDEVLDRARPGFSPGVTVVDHTTTSVAGTLARAKRWHERGVAFQHAPVFMGPQNALDATGVMMGSGEKSRFDILAPDLAKMTGKLVYLGAAPERAAAFKLMGNLFLMHLTSGIAEVLTLAKSMGIPRAEAATLFDWFNPTGTVGARIQRILGADFAHPSWELVMARKDARLMQEASLPELPLPVLAAFVAELDKWIARGHAHDDWTIVAKDAL